MARLPALIADLAEHDARGRPTVEMIARTIRENGLIATTKRGRGAAEMTPADAAALVIALCVAETPSTAPSAVERFLPLPALPPHPEAVGLTADAPEILQLADKTRTLGDFLKLFIEKGDLLEVAHQAAVSAAALTFLGRPSPAELDVYHFTAWITFHVSETAATFNARWTAGPALYCQYGRRFERVAEAVTRFDRRVDVTLGWRTFARIAALLAD